MTSMAGTNQEWDVVAAPIRAKAEALRDEARRLGIRREFDVRVASADIVFGLCSRDAERANRAVDALELLVAASRPVRRRRGRA
ncbi:hypothetical protein [Acuticoccus sediminis]|nr:hypothetical protein [Acuticoccus sediminis]